MNTFYSLSDCKKAIGDKSVITHQSIEHLLIHLPGNL